jgi:hypothetical protein
MSMEGADLLALVLELVAEGSDDDDIVGSLVMAAGGSATTLMGACTYALSLARDMPYDAGNERTLKLLTAALQRAVHVSGAASSEDRDTLLRHIVEYSGGWSMTAPAVASRVAELNADLETLRPPDDDGATASS